MLGPKACPHSEVPLHVLLSLYEHKQVNYNSALLQKFKLEAEVISNFYSLNQPQNLYSKTRISSKASSGLYDGTVEPVYNSHPWDYGNWLLTEVTCL